MGVVGRHKVVGYSEAKQFSRWNSLEKDLIALKMSQNIAKSMAYVIIEPSGDLKQGGYLYKLISCI